MEKRQCPPEIARADSEPLERPSEEAAVTPVGRDPEIAVRPVGETVGRAPNRHDAFDRLTQVFTAALDRRGLVGLASGALLALVHEASAGGKNGNNSARRRLGKKSGGKRGGGKSGGKGGGAKGGGGNGGNRRRKKAKNKKPAGCPRGCGFNEFCSNGVCVPACIGAQHPCPGAPGGCCPAGSVCQSGACVTPCADGRPRCGGICCPGTQDCEDNVCVGGPLTANLIQNGDAEDGADSSSCESAVAIPSWNVTTGVSTVCRYGNTTGGWPRPDSPGPVDRGTKFFTGGAAGLSEMTQTVDVSSFATQIDNNAVEYDMTAFLGGFGAQNDNAMLTAAFQTAAGAELDRVTIGPVTAQERQSTTGLHFRSAIGPVPVGTRKIQFFLTQTRSTGTSNDGYADNLSLVLRNA